MNKRIKGKIKNFILMTITLAAAYLVFASVGMIESPEWNASWWPLQICMFTVGMGWLWAFFEANGAFYDYGENDDQWDIF